MRAFGPYFTDRLGETPWGDALDYAEAGVREWAVQNAELWVRDYRLDGLRLDAVHAVHDDSPTHVLAELAERVRAVNPDALVISEMGAADFRPLTEWGHDAMWLDSLHHALHVALTGERDGYYAGFDGSLAAVAAELRRPEGAADRRGGPEPRPGRQPRPRRPAARREAAPRRRRRPLRTFTPLLFQGEEYGERAPFRFFTDHIDPFIADATREGRRREFARFAGFSGEVPDPQDVEMLRAFEADAARARAALRRACCACGASCRASSRCRSTRRREPSSSGAAAQCCASTSRAETVDLRRVRVWPGKPFPLGPWWDGEGTNFSLFSEHAEQVELCLFDAADRETRYELTERTAFNWHGYLPGIGPGQRYGYRVHGSWAPEQGHRFNPKKLLIDPYAKAIEGPDPLGARRTPSRTSPATRTPTSSSTTRTTPTAIPKGIVIDESLRLGGRPATADAVARHRHLRGARQGVHEAACRACREELRGTYAGLASRGGARVPDLARRDRGRAAARSTTSPTSRRSPTRG